MKKIFPLWASEKEISQLKQKAKKERQSVNQYVLKKALETPNLLLGDWWNNPDELKKLIKEATK